MHREGAGAGDRVREEEEAGEENTGGASEAAATDDPDATLHGDWLMLHR
jgi:hypothetical protein